MTFQVQLRVKSYKGTPGPVVRYWPVLIKLNPFLAANVFSSIRILLYVCYGQFLAIKKIERKIRSPSLSISVLSGDKSDQIMTSQGAIFTSLSANFSSKVFGYFGARVDQVLILCNFERVTS